MSPHKPRPRTARPPVDQYDPPRVETRLSPEELEREVQYAGTFSIPS